MTNREYLNTVVESMTDPDIVSLFMSGIWQDWMSRQVCETCRRIHQGCPSAEDEACEGGLSELEWLRMEHEK